MLRRFITVMAFLCITAYCYADSTAEIEALIESIRSLNGAIFIRNGSEHTPVEAADHLKLKWTKQSQKIHTAEDFIEFCATKSIMSGSAYRIRFADGHEEPSADFMKAVLDRLRESESCYSEPASRPQAAPTSLPPL